MGEATEILAQPETGKPAIAAETEAIELLLQSKRINPKGGGGGGSTPGGGGTGTTNDSALALFGGGVNDKEVREDRGISQATGEPARPCPKNSARAWTSISTGSNAAPAASEPPVLPHAGSKLTLRGHKMASTISGLPASQPTTTNLSPPCKGGVRGGGQGATARWGKRASPSSKIRNPNYGRVAATLMAAAIVASGAVLAQTPAPALVLPVPAGPEEKVRPPKPPGRLPAFAPTMEVPQAAEPKATVTIEKKARAPGQGALVKKAELDMVIQKQAAAANLAPLIDQFERQGRPFTRAELLLVRKTCQTSVAQLRAISHDADDALKSVATELAEAQQRPRRVVINGRVQQSQNIDGGKLLRERLTAVMKKHLTPEQWPRYQAETDKRLESRKQSGVRFLLATLDRELFLSDQQRDKLAESLSTHWEDGWGMYLEYILYGNQFFPLAVDPFVTPILNEHQTKVWQSSQRVGGFWGFGGVWGGFMNDNDALEEELGESPKKPPTAHVLPGALMGAPLMKTEVLRIETKKAVTRKAAAKQ